MPCESLHQGGPVCSRGTLEVQQRVPCDVPELAGQRSLSGPETSAGLDTLLRAKEADGVLCGLGGGSLPGPGVTAAPLRGQTRRWRPGPPAETAVPQTGPPSQPAPPSAGMRGALRERPGQQPMPAALPVGTGKSGWERSSSTLGNKAAAPWGTKQQHPGQALQCLSQCAALAGGSMQAQHWDLLAHLKEVRGY